MNTHHHLDSISVLKFSARSYNALMRVGICSIGDLLSCTKDDISGIRQLGAKSIEEITGVIDELSAYKTGIYCEIKDTQVVPKKIFIGNLTYSMSLLKQSVEGSNSLYKYSV